MRASLRNLLLAATLTAMAPAMLLATDADYEPPASYYSAATGTGSTLKTQLRNIMTSGFVSRSYDSARYWPAITDADPNHAGNILLVYNRASISSAWDPGDLPWNREHTWPASLLNDSSANGYSDMHMLRPCDTDINSDRGNNPFGMDNSSGSYGYKTAGYWYPGDTDSGDMARTMFYAATRYSALSLVEGSPTTYHMGDLSSLLHWHYKDTPDTFERRRNQAVYSSTMNPTYYQGNRNAYVDHPEYVWSVFVDQENDSQLTTSTGSVNLGRVIVGSSFGTQSLTINKTGVDGTYYQITAGGSATSCVTGRYAFAMDTTGSKTTTVGLSGSTATAGVKSGTVTVDNLDITTQGGAGKGANDANDVVNVSGTVVQHATPSFALNSTQTGLTLDFGIRAAGSTLDAVPFELFNRADVSGFTAGLDLDSIIPSGNFSTLTTTLATFANLPGGTGSQFAADLDTASTGSFSAAYTLNFSDENIPGATAQPSMTLTLSAIVAIAGDTNLDGMVTISDLGDLASNWQNAGGWHEGDFNGDGLISISDLGDLASNWQAGVGEPLSMSFAEAMAAVGLGGANVPEPAMIALVTMIGILLRRTGRSGIRTHE